MSQQDQTAAGISRRELLRTWGRYSALAVIAGTGTALALRRPAEEEPGPAWCRQQVSCRSCRSLTGCTRPAAEAARTGGDRG
jgi:hypothetical protein